MIAAQDQSSDKSRITVHSLLLRLIKPHPLNPRRDFDEAELRSLAESMAGVGLLEPIIVRRVSKTRSYELIAGERRLRAAALAGWKQIPAIIRDVSDAEALTMQLVENLQRADLNPIELARGLSQLSSQESEDGSPKSASEVGKLIGKGKGWVSDRLRLLKLPECWQERISGGEISTSDAFYLTPYASQPDVLARLEADMQKNPWAYRTHVDFVNNLRRVAEQHATAGAVHPNTRTTPLARPSERPPAVGADRGAPPIAGSDDAPATAVKVRRGARIVVAPGETTADIASIIIAIGRLNDVESLESVARAVDIRLADVQARTARMEVLGAACVERLEATAAAS